MKLDFKRISVYLTVAVAAILTIWVVYVFILPFIQLNEVTNYPLVTATTTFEVAAVAKANSLYSILNSSAEEMNNNTYLTQELSEKIGNQSFSLFITSGEKKIWASYYELKEGKIVNLEQNVDREADCYIWMNIETVLQIEKDYEKVAPLFIEGRIKISPPYCYNTFVTLARLIAEQ